ncbi:uncharacterized protein BDZ99DRAFT_86153 [Mytilinidion resinicola]|uniref:PWWP domain-containing protein n=1 Tax=Mytilinidion resinicola TaxID=574789 RepID=A0A6A6YFK2_9PEZI|nr:uncharacterized protein BDZ99DRAFT_86153 [Mytilinidion resinicola]KAF2806825.1 hypothetical protein BDZ99DRAFT_86153 [Mytilinidion resinicola]
MADTSTPTAPTEALAVNAEPTRPTKPSTTSAPTEAVAAEGGDVTKSDQPAAAGDKPAPIASAPTTSEELTATATTIENADDNGSEAPAVAAASNGTPASAKKSGPRRKSGAGVAEHSKKKALSRKKSTVTLRLDVEPGQYWFVAMRGFPPWPVIVCDEEMLPESLLSKRPVSAKRLDGTYREDFQEGAKNAKDRRYPIMFMGTNEFSWQVNTDLQPIDMDDLKKEVEDNNQGKKTKALWEAYQVAAEEHDLAWFKHMLAEHEKATLAESAAFEEQAEKAATTKKEKKEKGGRRKSAPVVDEDVEMEDGAEGEAAPKKAKATKKRKKDAESDAEGEKPAKTPKTKLKLTNKTPKDESAAKPKKTPKPKKAKAKAESEDEDDSAKAEEKPMTEAERKEKREKGVLYLRHRLQKGFLTRDQTPKEEEMATMSDYFKQLENYTDLEGEIIKNTKIHKVLKAIIKLNSIPKEEEFKFKSRSADLLTGWTSALSSDMETPVVAPAVPVPGTTNGVNGEKAESKPEEPVAPEPPAAATAPAETPAEAESTKKADVDGDVSMADAKDQVPAEEPTASTDAVAEPTAAA